MIQVRGRLTWNVWQLAQVDLGLAAGRFLRCGLLAERLPHRHARHTGTLGDLYLRPSYAGIK